MGARRAIGVSGHWAEVRPAGISGFDEGNFLGAAPALDFFLAGNRGAGGGVRLEPDEPGAVVFLGETGDAFLFVLKGTLREVRSDAEVEHARGAGHEVDVKGAGHGADCMLRVGWGEEKQRKEKRDSIARKEEERFLSSQADTFAGANVKEKASACFVRNDRWVVGGGEECTGRNACATTAAFGAVLRGLGVAGAPFFAANKRKAKSTREISSRR